MDKTEFSDKEIKKFEKNMGMLILPVLAVLLTPLVNAYVLMSNIIPVFWSGVIGTLLKDGQVIYVVYMFVVLIIALVFIVFPLVILVLFYQEKKETPKLMILFYCLSLVSGIVMYLFNDYLNSHGYEIKASLGDIIKPLFFCVFFIPYFLFARRVKYVFTK